MTAQELIAKVLELDAASEKLSYGYQEIREQALAAPILARICLKLIEQRDHFHAVCYRDLEPALEDESLRKINAELDRIAKGEE